MSDIKVSVIIPVYNVEKYLRRCLESVASQTLKEIEVICVDDGSTDSSFDIISEFSEKDPRFTAVRRQNGGAGAARNAGLDRARGKYLSFLDSDDFLMKKCLRNHITARKNTVPISLFFSLTNITRIQKNSKVSAGL